MSFSTQKTEKKPDYGIGKVLLAHWGNLTVFWAVDHSQLEIRFLAQVSGDKLLLKLIESGEDIHSAVGHELTGQPVEKVKNDRDLRTAVKQIHFGIIYGLKPHSLYLKLKADAIKFKTPFNMSEEDVTILYNKYFDRFTGVKKWLESSTEFARLNNYVETMFGFRREIIQEGDETRGTFWGNQAVNTPIQGGAHTLLLIAMMLTDLKKVTYDRLQDLAMEGHDALVGYCKLKDLQRTFAQAKQLMEVDVVQYIAKMWPEIPWRIPLKAEGKAGFRYGVLTKYNGEPLEQFIEKWCEECDKVEVRVEEEIRKSA